MRVGLHEPGDVVHARCCEDCSLIYVDPRPSADTLARYYQSVCPANEAFTFPADHRTNARYQRRARARWARLHELVVRHQPHPREVMDIGALDGASLIPHVEAGARGIAIDPGRDSRAPADARIEFFESLEAAARAGARADVIISTQTFEHLLAPGRVAQEAARLLTTEGVLVIEVPYDKLVIDGAAGLQLHPEHLNVFSREALRRLASVAGLTPVAIEADVQIHKYGGLIPSLTLVARRSSVAGRVVGLDAGLNEDKRRVARLQRRMKWHGRLTGLGRW